MAKYKSNHGSTPQGDLRQILVLWRALTADERTALASALAARTESDLSAALEAIRASFEARGLEIEYPRETVLASTVR